MRDRPAAKTRMGQLAQRLKTLLQLNEGVYDWLALVGILLSTFAVASLFTGWTGQVGRVIREEMLRYLGISVLVPLAFMGHLSFLRLTGREMPPIGRYLLGTLSLTVSVSLFVAMWGRAFGSMRVLDLAGALGTNLGGGAFNLLGPFGSVLLGLLACVVTIGAFSGANPGEILGELRQIVSSNWLESAHRPSMGGIGGWLGRWGRRTGPVDPAAETLRREDSLPHEDLGCEEDELCEPSELLWPRDNPFVEDQEVGDPDPLDPVEEPSVKPGTFPPPSELLGPDDPGGDGVDEAQLRSMAERIISSLGDFGVEAELGETQVGPTVIQFRLQLAPGTKVSKVASLANDLALALAVPSLRIEAPIPGKPYVGIEIPNPKRRPVPLRRVMEADHFVNPKGELPLPMGVGIDGSPMVTFLEDLPHLLVAGTTGSGKSVFINSCIIGLCSSRTPRELKLILIDPKRVEMAIYDKLPHILTRPVVDPKKAVQALAWAIREMERRYDLFAQSKVRNLASYNRKVLPGDRLPSVVLVVDELADLMMTAPREVEDYICRLAQMARATGIHLVLATQRPSVNVITGLIKANVPARVAFSLPSQADSRTILDCAGAERLLGKGDMLFLSSRFPKPIRLQSPWIDEGYISRWLDHLIATFGEPEVIDIEDQENGSSTGEANADDPLLEEAARIVLSSGVASASSLQRRLRVGFTRGARLIDTLEKLGIVGPPDGAKPREILVDEETAMEILREARGG
jgi:S-DNA-T family DNA segregation ATPase FtsK/SpoIIIE